MAVQYSIQKMVSDGTLSTIALGIQYLQRNDIYIRIAGEETPQSGAPSGYTWSFLDNTTLRILPVVPNGVEVVVYRRTDVDAMYNIYSQNAQFDEATIDENNQQLLYIAQEYLEQGIPGAGVDTLEYVRDDGSFTYYRTRRTDGSYSDEFAVPSASSSTKVLTRESLRRSYAEAGYTLVQGSFEKGGLLTSQTDVLLSEKNGVVYSWTGIYPNGGVVVAPGTDPSSSSFVSRVDELLRTQVTKRYNNVSSMLADPKLKVGDVAEWSGYYNVFDGGGNTGVVVAAGTGTNDGGSFFNLANGLQVKANMSDGICVDFWGPVNPNADLAFEKAIAYSNAHPSLGAIGPILYCGEAKYYEISKPIFFTASPLVGITLDLRKSAIKKVTATTSGKPPRLARGGSVTDIMDIDAVVIYDHQDNSNYVRGGIRGDGYLQNMFGGGVFAPRCYMMNFEEVSIDASNGPFGFKTHDTFMTKFHSIYIAGAERAFWWKSDNGVAGTGTTCAFSRCWAYHPRVVGWDIEGLGYSTFDSVACDGIVAPGAQYAYRFVNCIGVINGLGCEQSNVVSVFHFAQSQMTMAGIVVYDPVCSSTWMRITNGSRITYESVRTHNPLGPMSNGSINIDGGSSLIYDGGRPTNGAINKAPGSKINKLDEVTGYIAEVYFTVSSGVLTTISSEGCSVVRTAEGLYKLSFTNSIPDTNYRVDACFESSPTVFVVPGFSGKTGVGVTLTSRNFEGVATDCVSGSVKIFR